MVFSRLGRNYGREFWALRGVSFDVRPGETVGIIGRNGTGKTTLLQIIAGILRPSAGHAVVRGRTAALLELGSGFNPEYTGRENVFMNATILGMPRREIEELFDEIAAFAGIGEFMDQPLKTYSSGMFVRLAFAVQTFVPADILIIDEVLAVGDIGFQRKCYRRIEELRERGCTILLVSHDMNAVTHLCTRALLLDKGNLLAEGAPGEISERYQKLVFGEEISGPVERYGDGSAKFLDVWFEDDRGERVTSVKIGTELYYCYRVQFFRPINEPRFGMKVKDVHGIVVSSTNTQMMGAKTGRYDAGDEVLLRWRLSAVLTPGYYFFSCGCSYVDSGRFLCRAVDVAKLTVFGSFRNAGLADLVSDVSMNVSSSQVGH